MATHEHSQRRELINALPPGFDAQSIKRTREFEGDFNTAINQISVTHLEDSIAKHATEIHGNRLYADPGDSKDSLLLSFADQYEGITTRAVLQAKAARHALRLFADRDPTIVVVPANTWKRHNIHLPLTDLWEIGAHGSTQPYTELGNRILNKYGSPDDVTIMGEGPGCVPAIDFLKERQGALGIIIDPRNFAKDALEAAPFGTQYKDKAINQAIGDINPSFARRATIKTHDEEDQNLFNGALPLNIAIRYGWGKRQDTEQAMEAALSAQNYITHMSGARNRLAHEALGQRLGGDPDDLDTVSRFAMNYKHISLTSENPDIVYRDPFVPGVAMAWAHYNRFMDAS